MKPVTAGISLIPGKPALIEAVNEFATKGNWNHKKHKRHKKLCASCAFCGFFLLPSNSFTPCLARVQFHYNPVRVAEAQQLFVVGRDHFSAKLTEFAGCFLSIETSHVEAEVIDAGLLSGGRCFKC